MNLLTRSLWKLYLKELKIMLGLKSPHKELAQENRTPKIYTSAYKENHHHSNPSIDQFLKIDEFYLSLKFIYLKRIIY